MRLVRAGTGSPLEGVLVALDTPGGKGVDRGRTDDAGIWDPLWPLKLKRADLLVRDGEGELRIPLRRDDVHAAKRVDVEVPRRSGSNQYRFRLVDERGTPWVETEFRLMIGCEGERVQADVRTDSDGRASFHLHFPEGGTACLWRCGPIERRDRRVRWLSSSEPGVDLAPPEEVLVRIPRPVVPAKGRGGK
jgi:hypothetical protein